MNAFIPLLHREISRMIHASVMTIIIILFLVMMGGLFFMDFFDTIQPLSMRSFFAKAPLLLAFFCPALTMGRIAGERQDGTLALLQTMPLQTLHIVLAKFFACLFLLTITLACTLSYPATLSTLGPLDWGPVVGGYLALISLGGGYIAIGLFTSALAKDQVVAILTAFFLCLGLSYIHHLALNASGIHATFLQNLSASYHFANIAKGVLDAKSILYTLSLQFFALTATILVIEAKRYPKKTLP